MRNFCYYCCLSLFRTNLCFSFENNLSRDRSKRCYVSLQKNKTFDRRMPVR